MFHIGCRRDNSTLMLLLLSTGWQPSDRLRIRHIVVVVSLTLHLPRPAYKGRR
jgi:hypothetical protein